MRGVSLSRLLLDGGGDGDDNAAAGISVVVVSGSIGGDGDVDDGAFVERDMSIAAGPGPAGDTGLAFESAKDPSVFS